MSFFGKLFGAMGKTESSPSTQEAIQRLRESEELLCKKQLFLEEKISLQLEIARRHGTKNKREALLALKRKKRFEKQLVQIDGTLSTIEYQRESLENASTNTEVLRSMGFAAKALEKVHKDMDIDKVDDLMADIQEQQDLAQEVSDAISRPVGFAQEIDEDELLAELAEMEQEDLDKELLAVGEPELPSVPSTTIPAVEPAKQEDEDEDLRALGLWAS
uniref:charged multivesicular body protein 4c-like n=1 Tax=Myxine glutinosa TaxID=7769 RepID=UPI00358FAFD3